MLAQTLKQFRLANRLTQQELADELFVSRQTVSSWETGRNLPTIDMLAQLATHLNTTTDALLARTTPATEHTRTLAFIGPALAVLTFARLVIPTTRTLLFLSDGFIIALILVLWATHRTHKRLLLINTAALTVGACLLIAAWGQINSMSFELRTAYVLAGATVLCDAIAKLMLSQLPRRWKGMKHIGWWITNGVLLILFGSAAAWLLIRKVDGSGFVETTASRTLSLAVLAGFALFIIVIELIVYWTIKFAKRHE